MFVKLLFLFLFFFLKQTMEGSRLGFLFVFSMRVTMGKVCVMHFKWYPAELGCEKFPGCKQFPPPPPGKGGKCLHLTRTFNFPAF